ncbi:hypothetical protein BH11PSE8_BH11PSE8_05810 [soil metagenome]
MFTPRHVILFSGHMVDAPDRATPRFPPAKVPLVAQAIAASLAAIDADARDLALTQGAAGGDLLFAEACLSRGVRLQLMLPLPEAEFIRRSLLPSADGHAWRARFAAVRARLPSPPQVLQDDPASHHAAATSVFERCNEWLLGTAFASGQERVRFICLWDGGGGDGPGGTRHMRDEVLRRQGLVDWIDLNALQAPPVS